jgi:hypothetical protein
MDEPGCTSCSAVQYRVYVPLLLLRASLRVGGAVNYFVRVTERLAFRGGYTDDSI